MEMRVAGGGGYGDPLDRPAERVARDVRAGHVSEEIAGAVYGVIIGTGGEPDNDATSRRRESMRQQRGEWLPAVAAGERGHVSVAATGEGDRLIHEYVVARDRDGQRELACARCGEYLGGYQDNYREYLLMDEGPVTLIPTTGDCHYYLDDEMRFRRYCCPGCRVLMETEVVRFGEAVLPGMLLAAT